MKLVKHVLNDIWDKYPEAMSDQDIVIDALAIEQLIAEIFTMGQFYYYIINIGSGTLNNCSSSLLAIHGLQEYPKHLKDIIDLIHPDDLAFVMEAEAWTLEIYKDIGFENHLYLKSGYCFRMKVAESRYELFHHQAVHTAKDENGRLLQSVNIHTNINHITTLNNYIATINGIGHRNDFYQKTFKIDKIEEKQEERLTKRELEVLLLLTKNYSDKEIAKVLCISFHTVRTHHKNILRKTKSKNSFELLKRSLEKGYL